MDISGGHFPVYDKYRFSKSFCTFAEVSSTVEVYVYLGLVVLRMNGRRNAPHFVAYMPPLH